MTLADAAGRDTSAPPRSAHEPSRAGRVIEFYKKKPANDG
jgi:hypothetical protein